MSVCGRKSGGFSLASVRSIELDVVRITTDVVVVRGIHGASPEAASLSNRSLVFTAWRADLGRTPEEHGVFALGDGRSNIVGKPMAKMLLAESSNVTVLHSKTTRPDFERYISNADIIVVATGKQGILDESYKYKKSAVIVDVGINRDDSGLHGDAVPNLPVALQTPVPGGVGLLTRLALMENLLKLHK